VKSKQCANYLLQNKTIRILKDLGIIAFLVLFPHFFPLPFYTYTVVCFLLVWMLLRKEGKTFKNIGLTKGGITVKAVVIAIVSAVAWVVLMQLIYIPIIKHLFSVPDYTEYNFITKSVPTLLITIAAAWLIGGFYEEVLFRGYMPYLLEKRLFKSSGLLPSVMATGLLFGLYHWQQGAFGIIAAALGGIFWGILYKKTGNNLWIPIFSHALFDTITLALIYSGTFGNLY